MKYRYEHFGYKRYETIQEVIKDGVSNLDNLELFEPEVQSICNGLGIEKFDHAIVRYNGKLYVVYFKISDIGWFDRIVVEERKVIDITD